MLSPVSKPLILIRAHITLKAKLQKLMETSDMIYDVVLKTVWT